MTTTLDRSVEAACIGWHVAERRRLIAQIEAAAGLALSLETGSEDWKSAIGKIAAMEARVEELTAALTA